MTHTKGPWDCGRVGQTKCFDIIGADITGRGRELVGNFRGSQSKALDATNARLIAAAPDLLAALRWIVDCGDGCPTAIDIVQAMRHHAREVIAKAEGKVTK